MAAASATAAEAAASFFSIFSVWLALLSDVLSSRDAESDIVSSENCDSKVFAERKLDERLNKAFPSTDLAGYFNDLRAVLGVGPPVCGTCRLFSKPCRFSLFKVAFSQPKPEIFRTRTKQQKTLSITPSIPCIICLLVVRPGFFPSLNKFNIKRSDNFQPCLQS